MIRSWFDRFAGKSRNKLSGSLAGSHTEALAPAAAPEADIEAVEALLARVAALESKLDWASAQQLLEEALEHWPRHAELHRRLGQCHRNQGSFDDASDCFELALHLEPALVAAYLDLGALHHANGDYATSTVHYRRGLSIAPDSAALHSQLSLTLCAAGELDDALSAAEEAIRLNRRLGEAWHNLGFVRLQRHEPEIALDCFRSAIANGCDVPQTRACIAHALRDLGRLKEAIGRYRKVLAHSPDLDDAQRNLATTLLLRGDFERGWKEYESRFGCEHAAPRGFPYPAWKGESLAGRQLLIYAEQGLGDEILFASCIPDLLEQGADCVIECNSRLASLFRRSFPGVALRGGEKSDSHEWLLEFPKIACQTPIGNLPGLLRRGVHGFPACSGYLRADEGQIVSWRRRLEELGPGMKIGVSWRGGAPLTRGHARSIPLQTFATSFSTLSCHLVSLQHEATEEEVGFQLGPKVLAAHWPSATEDMDSLAALMCALDLVVSVDNTNIQLAGALGVSAWALLPYVPEWRYGIKGDRMPWYPSVRLFRQPSPRAWQPVLDNIASELSVVAERARN